jgi:hypothetical protein
MAKGFVPPHGGCQNLLSFEKGRVVFDATLFFCEKFLARCERVTKARLAQRARQHREFR